MPGPQVTVTFDCTATTFNIHPDHCPVPPNYNGPITWKVVGSNKGPGVSVQFPPTGGVVFKPGSNWPGTTPVISPTDSTEYSANDNNVPGAAGEYPYSVTVLLNNNGTVTPYSHDPDVDNQGSIVKT